MQNIQQDDAHSMVMGFINELAGNLLVPYEVEEHSSEAPKARWIEPLIADIKTALLEINNDADSIVPVPDTRAVHQDYETVTWHLDQLIKELSEDLENHDGIRSEDDQYEDPQEWWLRPLVYKLKTAKNNIFSNVYL